MRTMASTPGRGLSRSSSRTLAPLAAGQDRELLRHQVLEPDALARAERALLFGEERELHLGIARIVRPARELLQLLLGPTAHAPLEPRPERAKRGAQPPQAYA